MTDKRTLAFQAFHTEEPFKAVAARIKSSPNTVRAWWVEDFGKEAFVARGKAIQSKAARLVGAAKKGTTCNVRETVEACCVCGAEVRINLIQKARLKRVLCPTCTDKERGVDRTCPVCGIGCAGVKGLAMHLTQVEDDAHEQYQVAQEEANWEGLEEGKDFVRCLVCGHRGLRIDRHISSEHSLSVAEYRNRFPGAEVQSDKLREARSVSAITQHQESPRKGLTKEIQCPSCGNTRQVGLTFAPKMHESRCPDCVALEGEANDELKWSSLVEGRDYVVCQACGHRAESLVSHIRSVHPELEGKYQSVYFGALIVALDSDIRDKTYLRGKTLSESTRELMSKNAGRWNKGLTKETDLRMAQASESMKGRPSWSKGLTKEDHPELRSASEKLSALKTGVPNDISRLDLSSVDFTPYLDEVGAVDLKLMSEELDVCDPTLRKYMRYLGLRRSTKYVDARAERQTIRLEKEDLTRFSLNNGKIVVAQAMVGLQRDYKVIKRECERHGLKTFTHLIRQTICLDAISKALGSSPYEQEWRSRKFMTPKGNFYRFDGYFPLFDLIVEFHGWQHWVFPSVYIKKEELYFALQERDRAKENLIHSDPTLRYFLVREDEPYADPEYLRGRLIDEGILDPGK